MKSYNGWDADTDKRRLGIVPLIVDGHSFPGGCKGGDVHTIFSHFLHAYHTQVEPLGLGTADDEWGYVYRTNRNDDNLSCHSSGTAVDVNATLHPNGKRRTLSPAKVALLRKILAVYEGVIKWGGDFTGTSDEMHYEIRGTEVDVRRIALKITAKPKPAPAPADDYPFTLEDVMLLEMMMVDGEENWFTVRPDLSSKTSVEDRVALNALVASKLYRTLGLGDRQLKAIPTTKAAA